MRRMRASLRIQTCFRRHDSRRKYLSLKSAALALQCAVRWRIAGRVHLELKRNHRATKLQSWQRMLGPWKRYRLVAFRPCRCVWTPGIGWPPVIGRGSLLRCVLCVAVREVPWTVSSRVVSG